jgi:hypothetical protein
MIKIVHKNKKEFKHFYKVVKALNYSHKIQVYKH